MSTSIAAMLPYIPRNYRDKGKALLEHIHAYPDTCWNERREFIYRGKTMKGTDIIDLVNDALRLKMHGNAREWKLFAKALRKSRVDSKLIRNPLFKKRRQCYSDKKNTNHKTELFISFLKEEHEKIEKLIKENEELKQLLKKK